METGTTKQKIREWLKQAKDEGNISHIIIVCDTFDYEDYPVRVKVGQDVHERMREYSNGKNMQQIMEIYNMRMGIEAQLDENMAWHPDNFDSSKSSSEEEE